MTVFLLYDSTERIADKPEPVPFEPCRIAPHFLMYTPKVHFSKGFSPARRSKRVQNVLNGPAKIASADKEAVRGIFSAGKVFYWIHASGLRKRVFFFEQGLENRAKRDYIHAE